MPPLFNAADYASVPKVNAANAVPIVRKLLVLTPKGAPESVRLPARAMRAHAEALRTSRLARRKRQKPANRRTVDHDSEGGVVPRAWTEWIAIWRSANAGRVTAHEPVSGASPSRR